MAAGDDERESFAALFERSEGAGGKRRRFQPGDRVDVRVVAIGRDAVFADLGRKQEGYFERSELVDAEGKVAVAAGDVVAASVASIDATGQVRLLPVFVRRGADQGGAGEASGARGAVAPLSPAAPVLGEGARVRGKVTGVERYGLFVQVAGTTGRAGRGLVPSSDTGIPRGSDPAKHFSVGQEVEAKIVRIAEDGKIRLSMTALEDDEERAELEAFRARAAAPAGEDAPGQQGVAPGGKPGEGPKGKSRDPRSFGTLGDLLAKRPARK